MKRALVAGIISGASIAVAQIGAHMAAVSSSGSITPLIAGGFVLGAALFASVVALLSGLIMLAFKRSRAVGAAILIVTSFVILGMMVGSRLGWVVRRRAFAQLARRAAPLIRAINLFEKHTGRLPMSLQDLVPGYLSGIPTTQMASGTSFDYSSGNSVTELFPGNTWVIFIAASSGPLNWDEFVYLPAGNYPLRNEAGSFERVGDWAYLHE